MRILTVAVLSFMLGATLASLYGSQTSTPQAPAQSPQKPNVDAGVMPVVPPVFAISSQFVNASGGLVVLDGYRCRSCNFRSITLRYGGGVFDLTHSTVDGTVNIELVGAAANTVAFLSNLGIGLCKFPAPIERPNPNRPIIQVATFEKPVMIDLMSPYGQP
jgi:hypothetical protein